MEKLVNLELPDQPELVDYLACQDYLVPKGIVVFQDLMELKENKGLLVKKEFKEIPDLSGQLVQR